MNACECCTAVEQRALEERVVDVLERAREGGELCVARHEHVAYLVKGLEGLNTAHTALDASRPWLVYWMVHALGLLGDDPDDATRKRAAAFLASCQAPGGGFGGGPGQLAHLAATYAACAAMAEVGDVDALARVDRQALYAFLMAMKVPRERGGGFTMTWDGEVDVRGAYCALAAADIFGLLTPELCDGVGEYVATCQTYEGGCAGEPGVEAHGGYTFCGLAAACIAGQEAKLDLPKLLAWAAHRQGSVEGGFNGRTHKLVDGCYSFWQGGIFVLLRERMPSLVTQLPGSVSMPAVLLEARTLAQGAPAPTAGAVTATGIFPTEARAVDADGAWAALLSVEALQGWLLACCQLSNGGMRDKPGTNRDYYHTCYCLSGLALAQQAAGTILGHPLNALERTDPLLNVTAKNLARWRAAVAASPFTPGGGA